MPNPTLSYCNKNQIITEGSKVYSGLHQFISLLAAYPSPPNSTREREGVPHTTCEDFGQKLGSSAAISSLGTASPTNSLDPVTHLNTPDEDPRVETVLPKASTLKRLLGIDY
jgi:hypothetical protein